MEFIQQNFLLVAIAVISGTMLLASTLRRPAGGHALTPMQATLLINRQDALIVDVRDSNEYVGGHLPEARNIPADQLEQRIGEIDKFKDTPVLLVCQSGSRSGSVCKKLEGLGFTKVHNLEGGISGWLAAGLPLKKGAKK